MQDLPSSLCRVDWPLMIDVLKTLWTWPTLIAVACLCYRKRIGKFLDKIQDSPKFRVGGLSFDSTPPSAPTSARSQAASDPAPHLDFGTLRTVMDRHFIKQTIPLDGIRYVRCVFEDCVLEFDGTGTSSFVDVRFAGTDTRWHLTGCAANTTNFLASIYGFAGPAVDTLVAKIQRGDQSGAPSPQLPRANLNLE